MGGFVSGNTQPVGEIVREVVGTPVSPASEGSYGVEQTIQAQYAYVSSSGPVFSVQNPHNVDCLITRVHVAITANADTGSSVALDWDLVASSSKRGTGLADGVAFNVLGVSPHYNPSAGAPAAAALWKARGFSSDAWLTATYDIGGGHTAASSVAAKAFISIIPLYST